MSRLAMLAATLFVLAGVTALAGSPAMAKNLKPQDCFMAPGPDCRKPPEPPKTTENSKPAVEQQPVKK